MLFADNVDKKLLPKNILILNARRKVETLVEFCLMHGINFKIFEHNGKGNGNISEKLRPYTTFLPEEKLFDPQYYIKNLPFVPEYICNSGLKTIYQFKSHTCLEKFSVKISSLNFMTDIKIFSNSIDSFTS